MRTTIALAVAVLLLASTPLQADEVLKPTKEYSKYRKLRRRMSPEEIRQYAEEYVEKWEATGKETKGAQRYALAQFQQDAGQYKKAAEGFSSVMKDASQKERTRDYAATAEAGVLLLPELRAEMTKEALDEAVTRLSKYADGMTSNQQFKSVMKLRKAIARLHDMAGRQKEGVTMRLKIIETDPREVSEMARPIAIGLREMTHTMAGYEEMRAKAKKVMATLRGHLEKKLREARTKLDGMRNLLRQTNPDALGPDGRLVKTDRKEMDKAERAVDGAQRGYDRAVALGKQMDLYEQTIALLGTQAKDWTLEKEYGDVKSLADLKGKVVVMDFWLTSGARCNFPVLRDLMKEFKGKPFTVLGVTATSHVVYETRYDFDEDYSNRVYPGERKQYAARLATEMAPADQSAAILEEVAYREAEMRVIGSFIQNHDLKWPHVMIEDEEAQAKYALEGWPHLVVLDKQGRIRHLKSSSLSRKKKELVDAFRKVINDLLAE